MKASKKLLSLLLVLVMMISVIPFQALAEDTVDPDGEGEPVVQADDPITVPVTVEYQGNTYEKSFEVKKDGYVTLTEAFAKGLLSSSATPKKFVKWLNNSGADVTGKKLSYGWLKEQTGYSLTMVLEPIDSNDNETPTQPSQPTQPSEPETTPPETVIRDTITVFMVPKVGGVTRTPVELVSGSVPRGTVLEDWLDSQKTTIRSIMSETYNMQYASYTFFYDSSLKNLVKGSDITNGDKTVYIGGEAKSGSQAQIYLYVYTGKNPDVAKYSKLLEVPGYLKGEEITLQNIKSFLINSANIKNPVFYGNGMYDADSWDLLVNKGLKPDTLPKMTVGDGATKIYILLTNSTSSSTADPTNPKTGDYILDTAMTLMVISGLAAAAVYVVGKKRRV